MNKTMIELFAGVGGFRLGLEKFGFKTVFANQYEPSSKNQFAFDCYDKRFSEGIKSNVDIAKVDTEEIPNHNLLVGGFPCQDYSVARTQADGLKGKKGVLFWEIYRILKDKRPAFLLLENVDRLLKSPSKQRGRDFGVMLASLNNLGYGVEWRIINAADYGFPQRRRRVFIFGFHKSTKYFNKMDRLNNHKLLLCDGFFANKFPVIENILNESECVLKNDLVEMSDKFKFGFENTGIMMNGQVLTIKTEPIVSNKITSLGDILESNVDKRYYLTDKYERFKYLKGSKRIERVSKTGHKYIYSEGAIAFPDPLHLPARTILTSEGSVNRSTHVVQDPETKRLRLLTPVECERINGFPDNWTSTGMSDRQRYFCMGNALVVGLIERMGRELSTIFNKED